MQIEDKNAEADSDRNEEYYKRRELEIKKIFLDGTNSFKEYMNFKLDDNSYLIKIAFCYINDDIIS